MWVSPLFFCGEALPACLRAPRCPACLPSPVVRLATGPQHQGFCAHYIAGPSCLCSHKSLISKQVRAQETLCTAGHACWCNVWHAPATAICVRQQPVSPSGRPPHSSVSRAPPPSFCCRARRRACCPPACCRPWSKRPRCQLRRGGWGWTTAAPGRAPRLPRGVNAWRRWCRPQPEELCAAAMLYCGACPSGARGCGGAHRPARRRNARALPHY